MNNNDDDLISMQACQFYLMAYKQNIEQNRAELIAISTAIYKQAQSGKYWVDIPSISDFAKHYYDGKGFVIYNYNDKHRIEWKL